ncbi:NAD-dependent epimerase/dehydratase family protein [Cohnella endophytica]|uniref:NAD-dependent epimerase/dehydratase family protein n=1 Tax=Cohnella endophytica TaxID=2419778 RepID=A0A494Y692_9BACL|nr:NAD(P)H-binding protein [Cohnella endophytica]RKP58189.1 NAD-dependent epimerase/dehydratase family protein [Cohnella endophytica]
MLICVLGATGRIGQEWLKLALADDHRMRALVRDPNKINAVNDRFTWLKGDATDLRHLVQASEGAEAVISALSTDGGNVLSVTAPLLVKAMKVNGIKRLISIGTAGILDSRAEPGRLRYESSESRRKMTRSAMEHHRFYEEIAQSGLDWTIVCPTYLPDGPYTGNYRIERDRLPVGGESISVADTAEFAFHQLRNKEFISARVGISY